MYRTLAEEVNIVGPASLEASPGLVWVNEPSLATKQQRLEQLPTRTLSVLHRMTDVDFATGLASLEKEVACEPEQPEPGQAATMLVLRKPA